MSDHPFMAQPGSNMCVCGAPDVSHPEWVRTAIAQLTRERDLAIAHDTQPYPTAWAYKQVCAALKVAKAETGRVRAENALLREANRLGHTVQATWSDKPWELPGLLELLADTYGYLKDASGSATTDGGTS